jgi:hypothetical protein
MAAAVRLYKHNNSLKPEIVRQQQQQQQLQGALQCVH